MTWKPLLETQGIDLHPLRDMKNAVFTIRGLLQGERIPWDGGTLGLEVNRKCFYEALPPTKNPVPIYIGAVGPRMTELTGEIGDGLILELVVRRDVFPTRLKHLQIGLNELVGI